MKKVTVIGMDLGDKNHKAVGLSDSGEEVDRAEVVCTPEGVRAYLERHPGAMLAIETGAHCRWVARLAEELGHEVLVGNARKLRMIWQSSRKDDWRDAEMLARVARADRKLFHPVKLRDAGNQRLMRLVKARDVLVRNRTAIINQVRGFCKAEGARLPRCSAEAFVNLKASLPPEVMDVASHLFKMLRELNDLIRRYDRIIAKALKRLRGEDAALLEPIAGVGPMTAAAYLAAVGDVGTFGGAREAGPYFGLAPRRDQSGATDKQLRISKEGNEIVRRLLVTAANYIMGPFGKESDLRRHGMRIAERGGKNARKRAKVAVARKLAVVMLAVLRNRTAYRPLANVEAVA